MILVKAYADLRRFLPEGETQIEAGASLMVSELLARLGIPFSEINLLVVNGRCAEHCTILYEGDVVELIPAISGG